MKYTGAKICVCALASALLLCGCTAGSQTTATAESAQTGETAVNNNLDLNSLYDGNGYYKGITATDYVTLPDLSAIPVEISEEEVNAFVEDSMNSLTDTYGTITVVDREAQKGDRVTVDYTVTADGNDPFSGTVSFVLGRDEFLTGMDEHMMGHKTGEKIQYTETVDSESPAVIDVDNTYTSLTGNISVDCTIKEIAECVLEDSGVEIALGDAVALSDGSTVMTVDQAKQYYLEQAKLSQAEGQIVNYLMNNSTVSEIPEQILQKTQKQYEANVKDIASQSGVRPEEYLQSCGYNDMDAYLAACDADIRYDITKALVIQAAAESLDLKADTKAAKDFYGEQYDSMTNAFGTNAAKEDALAEMVVEKLTENL